MKKIVIGLFMVLVLVSCTTTQKIEEGDLASYEKTNFYNSKDFLASFIL